MQHVLCQEFKAQVVLFCYQLKIFSPCIKNKQFFFLSFFRLVLQNFLHWLRILQYCKLECLSLPFISTLAKHMQPRLEPSQVDYPMKLHSVSGLDWVQILGQVEVLACKTVGSISWVTVGLGQVRLDQFQLGIKLGQVRLVQIRLVLVRL